MSVPRIGGVMIPKTLEDWRATIKKEVRFVGKKPFSHNIINLTLSAINSQFGKEEANRAVVDFGLERLGWSVEK